MRPTTLAFAIVFAVAPAFAELPPLIPREVLFSAPENIYPLIAPDGKRLAWLAPDAKQVLQIWVRTVGKDDGKQVSQEKKRPIVQFLWAEDVDLKSGAVTLDTRNPGDVEYWIVDNQMVVRGAVSHTPDGGNELRVRSDGKSPWKTLVKAPAEEVLDFFAFSADGKAAILKSSLGVDKARLVLRDLASGAEKEIAKDGGPWARDTWGYSPDVQQLANRGYAVLQPNFRGSTGYGKKFLHAGDRQWGKKMPDDLVDAVKWAVAEGIADDKRVAIYGGSYGGYSALAGATFSPDLFRCAIDEFGISNLTTFIKAIPPFLAAELGGRAEPSTEAKVAGSTAVVKEVGRPKKQ